ncbi:hypothetical protein [Clostridium sp.]|uniref:hypothetical protein n=1 Tax=Clostridium sp. TaxID=1506 RepID=UPI001A45FEE4|nr:hypothetical protein [Clostridium sp.]MBK5235484.1 hypothetical protein [Clostridium sp.]
MSQWWGSLGDFERIFWVFAFPSTAAFILQMIMTFIGLDGHGDMISDTADSMQEIPQDSVELENYDSAGEFLDLKYKFKLVTIRSLVVFFTVFSWTGIVATTSGKGKIATVIIALISGFVMMYIVSYIYFFLSKFVEDGTMNITNAINREGQVYLTIPERRENKGKVEIVVQGALRLLEAVTDGDAIATGNKVVVISIVENQFLLVEKID